MKREYVIMLQGALAATGAFLSDKLGILFPVLCILLCAMVVDYISGMLASKEEAIEHPGDPAYGWNSKKGAMGIIKKVGYACVIAAALIVDYVVSVISTEMGIHMPMTAFFGLLVAVWYVLNELLSIVENAGRMGVQVPEWLCKYIAVLKHKIDESGDAPE